jgi:hypothetical protein
MKFSISDLSDVLNEAREIVRYYRTGPLGDVAAANGKIVEEALRKVLQDKGNAPVTTSGLVDLGVKTWDVGLQVKTFRKKANQLIFARSNKDGKEARILDIKSRVKLSLEKTETSELVLLKIDMFSSNFEVYHLASNRKGKIITHGSFLKSSHVSVSPTDTHFFIKTEGLKPLV